MSKKLLIQEHKKKLLFNEFFQLKELIKAENPSSVIASLNDGYLKKYLNKCILSNFIYVYLCINKKKIIGYAIFAKKPDYLISEHIIKPWLAEEFFNCLAFFLMTRKPLYWRNGKSKIQLLHPVEGLDIDLLMDQ